MCGATLSTLICFMPSSVAGSQLEISASMFIIIFKLESVARLPPCKSALTVSSRACIVETDTCFHLAHFLAHLEREAEGDAS